MKYIDAEKLIAHLKKTMESYKSQMVDPTKYPIDHIDLMAFLAREYQAIIANVESFQQEQPIEGKQVVIITETDGDANIHWDCRSLDDVKALLASAQSFIADKQVEELRGMGSGPDYNTTEGRFRKAHEFKQKQPEVDLEKEIKDYFTGSNYNLSSYECWTIARHFYELGKNAK